jgi:hypothetical protein
MVAVGKVEPSHVEALVDELAGVLRMLSFGPNSLMAYPMVQIVLVLLMVLGAWSSKVAALRGWVN